MSIPDYSIKTVDINDSAILAPVNELVGRVFGFSKGSFPNKRLKINTSTNSQIPSVYLAAIKGDEVIGFNAFISHTFYLNNEPISCFQSCWTATSPEHRGKKIFQNLIGTAKQILSAERVGFLFGFPNEKSRGIFINKLGFRELTSLKLQVPSLDLFRRFYLRQSDVALPTLCRNAILQNDDQLIDLKRQEYGKHLVIIKEKESLIWGVIREKKLKIKYFDIGGIDIKSLTDVEPLFRRLTSLKGMHYFQAVTTINNSFNRLLSWLKPAQTNNLIVYDLGLNSNDFHFNFYSGVRDVY